MSETRAEQRPAEAEDTDGSADNKRSEKDERMLEKDERAASHQDAVARLTSRSLHLTEDLIYALTALVLVLGAFVVLGQAVYELIHRLPDGITKAIEATLDSLLIVFILVELLTAVRSAIDEHFLVAEPFLLVGILASIKEMVVLSTFRIQGEKAGEGALKIGVLGAIVIGLAVATLILRRREREPKESGDSP